MKSASESSSAPKRDEPFSARAIRPSTPSRMAATRMASTAWSKWPSAAKRMAVRPAQSASSVTTFGTTKRSGRPRRPRGLKLALAGPGVSGGRPASMPESISADLEMAFRLAGTEIGQHGFARDGAGAKADEQAGAGRRIGVDARYE